MAYLKSNARVSFEHRVDNLKKTAKKAAYRYKKIPSDVRDVTFHAAILETSAALEEYIKVLLDDYKYKIQQSGLPLKNLPNSIRTYLLIKRIRPHFENLTYFGDERRALHRLDIDSNHFKVLNPNASVGHDIDIVSILDGKKYPSPKNWHILFLRLGIINIFDCVNNRLKRDSISFLESFNDVRTTLAHGHPPNLTYIDIQRHLDNMKSFVNGVDRVLCTHFCNYSGKCTWPHSVS